MDVARQARQTAGLQSLCFGKTSHYWERLRDFHLPTRTHLVHGANLRAGSIIAIPPSVTSICKRRNHARRSQAKRNFSPYRTESS
jgi:hypothetical protein